MKTTIYIQISVIPMTMIYSSALASYKNKVNQIFPNESSVKSNNRRIQITASPVGIGVRGGRGRQSCGGWGGHGGCGRGTIRINYDLEVTGLNLYTIRMYPVYRFETDEWFNITEDTWLQLTHMLRGY